MSSIIKGDLFSTNYNYTIITTNAVVKKDGCLVMGAGIAKVVRDKWKGIDYVLGQQILRHATPKRYGLIVGKRLGILQTKNCFSDKSDLELVKYSVELLRQFALEHPKDTIGINYPAIGCGGLKKFQVQPILNTLPNNVFIHTK